MKGRFVLGWFTVLILLGVVTKTAWSCACGCGIFDVQTSAMFPTQPGGMMWLESDFMNQNENWHGTLRAPADNNDDKQIYTHFFTAKAQYMFNRSWGIETEVPYWTRQFTTVSDDADRLVTFNHSALGDIQVKGVYSGFSEDMSSGVNFGIKVPTGNFTYPGFDRDTEIGTGSTNLLFGIYSIGNLGRRWNWFANGKADLPVFIHGDYRPGNEVDAVAGMYYDGWNASNFKIAPIAQMIGSIREHDSGIESNPEDTGYQRFLLSGGAEVVSGGLSVCGNVAFPVIQHVRGNQLLSPQLFTLTVGHSF